MTAKDRPEKTERINEQKTYLRDNDSGGTISTGIKVSSKGDQIFYDKTKKTIWSSFLYGKQLYVKEAATKLNWKIEKETKKIGKFICKKATTTLRGRDYIVWFVTEISTPFGPWKLNVLTGLILEEYDRKKFECWYFKSVEYPIINKVGRS